MDAANVILTVPAVLAIVELLKRFGVVGRWAMLAAVGVAVALYAGAYFLDGSGAWQAVTQGLLVGLAAAGLYDTAQVAGKAPKVPEK